MTLIKELFNGALHGYLYEKIRNEEQNYRKSLLGTKMMRGFTLTFPSFRVITRIQKWKQVEFTKKPVHCPKGTTNYINSSILSSSVPWNSEAVSRKAELTLPGRYLTRARMGIPKFSESLLCMCWGAITTWEKNFCHDVLVTLSAAMESQSHCFLDKSTSEQQSEEWEGTEIVP